jgi:ATP-dependent RNA helicase DeaD
LNSLRPPQTGIAQDREATTKDGRSDAGEGFASLGLSGPLVAAVAALGYEEPTAIQREAIPILLAGRDVLGQAATGTGKTAAFALPLLQRIAEEPATRGRTTALVLVPTRELAMQVAEAVHKYGRSLNVHVAPLFGGAPMDQQVRALKRGVEAAVATPGRALDHLHRGNLKLGGLRLLVLDEADEMLDMGFAEDLEAILAATPATRQTALFSATLPSRIVSIAERHMKNPVRVTIAREKPAPGKLPRLRQVAYIVPRAQKPAALARVLEMEDPTSAIVFCRTRVEVDELTETLNAHGYRGEALHGGMAQRERDRVMRLFRSGKADLLVATDVAARGLDIAHVSHVVNYDVPSAPEAYLHRVGRTGRVGRAGVAITLAEPREQRQLRNIEAFIKQKIAIATVPTSTDLQARRLDRTREALRERILARGFDDVRGVVESLAGEFDVMDIAAAAVKMVHGGSSGAAQAVEMPGAATAHKAAPRERPPKPQAAEERPRNRPPWKRKRDGRPPR